MRIAKQIVYGIVFLGIIALVLLGLWSALISSPPSCFDSKKNQGEEDVDCGGPCVSCSIRSVRDVEVRWAKVFRAADGVGVAAELYNPNSDWAASHLEYRLTLKNELGEVLATLTGTTFAYAGELKYVVYPLVSEGRGAVSADMRLLNPTWTPVKEFVKPEMETQSVQTKKEDVMYVSGRLVNHSERVLGTPEVYALLFNEKDALIAASKTELGNVASFGSHDFRILFFKDLVLKQTSVDYAAIFPRTLRADDQGEDVKSLQGVLLEFGLTTRQPTGYFDQATADALSQLRVNMGFAVSPEFDEPMRQALIRLLASQMPQPTPEEREKAVDPTRTRVVIEVMP